MRQAGVCITKKGVCKTQAEREKREREELCVQHGKNENKKSAEERKTIGEREETQSAAEPNAKRKRKCKKKEKEKERDSMHTNVCGRVR